MSSLFLVNYVIDRLAGREDSVRTISTLLTWDSAISVVTTAEVLEGVIGGRNRDSTQRAFDDFVQALSVLDITFNIPKRVTQIRLQLRQPGGDVNRRALDILIATTAIEHNLKLVCAEPSGTFRISTG